VCRHPIVFMLLSAGFAGLMLSYALFVTVSVRLMMDPAPGHAMARSPFPARVVPATSAPPRGGVTAPGPAVPAPWHPHAHQGTPRVAVAHDRRAPGPGSTAQAPSPSPTATP